MFAVAAENFATILTGLVVLFLVAAAAIKLIRDKKNNKNSCSCGCGNCSGAGICHKNETGGERNKKENNNSDEREKIIAI